MEAVKTDEKHDLQPTKLVVMVLTKEPALLHGHTTLSKHKLCRNIVEHTTQTKKQMEETPTRPNHPVITVETIRDLNATPRLIT